MPSTVYTVGHSNQSLEQFIALLRQAGVEVLADVRSAPYSRYVPHFNKPSLEAALHEAGLHYVYLGRELGGRPEGTAFYDADGHVLYSRVADSDLFREGIERVKRGIARYCVALMCSEEDPAGCHRNLLVARVLDEREGVRVLHIRGDGHLDRYENPYDTPDTATQMSLFSCDDTARRVEEWRSIRSVLPRSRPSDSSGS